MAKKKSGKVKPTYVPKAKARPGSHYAEDVRSKANELTERIAAYVPTLNRVLLVILLVVTVLWLTGAIAPDKARYGIIMTLGVSLALNGVSGYKSSRWAGFFLMIIGAVFFLSNLIMLLQ